MDLDKYKYPVPVPPNMNPSFLNEQQKYLTECNRILIYLNENTGTNNGICFFENVAAIFPDLSISVLDRFIFPKLKVDGFITILNGVFAPSSVNARIQFKISDEARVFIANGGYTITNPKSLKDFTIEILQLLDEKGKTVEISDFIHGFHKQNNVDTADIKFKLDALKRDGIISIIGHEFLAASKGFSSIQRDSIHASITIKGEEYLKSLYIPSRIIESVSNANVYYQIIVDLKYFVSFPGKSSDYLYEFDLTDLNGIERDRMMPYLKNQKIIVGGRELCKEEIDRFIVLKSSNTTTENIKLATKNNPSNAITKSVILGYTEYYTDITSEVHNRVQQKINSETNNISMMDYSKNKFGNTHVSGSNNIVNIAAGNIQQSDITFNITKTNYNELRDLGVEDAKIDELKEIIDKNKADKPTLTTKAFKWVGDVGKALAVKGLTENLPKITDYIGHLIHTL